MTNNRALVLGVTASQVDLIRRLKTRGWFVVSCAHKKRGLGLQEVDEFELVDIKNPEAIEETSQRYNADLICSMGSDLGAKTASIVRKRLGHFNPFSPDTVERMNKKQLLRSSLNQHDELEVRSRVLHEAADLEGWSTYPAVLKPTDSSGQRGVSRVENQQSAVNEFPNAVEHSSTDRAILETYLHGPEFSANVLVQDGHCRVVVPTERRLLETNRGIPEGHRIGTDLMGKQEPIRNQIEQACQILEIQNGILYVQLKDTSSGFRIVEMAPRLDGCHIWRLIRAGTDLDFLDLKIDQLIGGDPDPDDPDEIQPYTLTFFFSEPELSFDPSGYTVPEEAVFHEFYYKKGEHVRTVNGVRERVGYYIQRESE